MRFFKDGASIPDDLLIARDEGRVVFFCGAGVSKAKAGLTDFFGLTESVLDNLQISPDHTTRLVIKEAREIVHRTGASGLISVDRIFGLLEREFLVQDVEKAVANSLRPTENVDLSAHRIVLDLATTAEGKVRLVTTNFDRLFEACLKDPQIWQPPRLPDPSRAHEFDGIVHLHGVASKNYDSAEGDGFILSSSEFGRAYLSEGWATKFFREILDQYVVVFIGYGADDPPVQYLLEALNRKKGQFVGVYAFQDGTEKEAIGKWLHKGIEAIAYDGTDNHRVLWDTLAAWVERAKSPENWCQSVIDLAKQGPEALQPFQRGQVAHIVSTFEGAKKFSDGDELPPAEWLCVFDPLRRYTEPVKNEEFSESGDESIFSPFLSYGLDTDKIPQNTQNEGHNEKSEILAEAWDAFSVNARDRQNMKMGQFAAIRGYPSINGNKLPGRLFQLGIWISKVADQPSAVWWAGKQVGLHPEIQRHIQWEINRGSKVISPVVRQAWQYLFEIWKINKGNADPYGFNFHDFKSVIEKDGWSSQAVRQYAVLSRPYLIVKTSRIEKPPDRQKRIELGDILNIDVEYLDHDNDIDVSNEWLSAVVIELRKNLEFAQQLEKEMDNYYFYDIGSILADDDLNVDRYSRSIGLYGCVIKFSVLFESLVKFNIDAAKREFAVWPTDNQIIFSRLRIWAAGITELVSEQFFVSILLELSDDDFWDFYNERDLLRVLAFRWNHLPKCLQLKLEARLLSGPRQRDNNEADEEFNLRCAWLTLDRLHWLANHSCRFSFDLAAETEIRQQYVPGWSPQSAQKIAAEKTASDGLVKYDEAFSPLLTESLDAILSKAWDMSGFKEDFSRKQDPYAGFCRAYPIRAFSALSHNAKMTEFPNWAWRTFLYSEARKNDKPKLSALIAERINQYPSENLTKIINPLTSWLKTTSKLLAESFPRTYQNIIATLIAMIELQPSASSSEIRHSNKPHDWVFEAINSSVGHLTEILMSDPVLVSLKASDRLQNQWESQASKLLALPGDSHRYVVVIFARHLDWFYSRDPQWTEDNLLANLVSDNDDDRDAFWSGFLWAGIPSQKLYLRLKREILYLAKNGGLIKREHGQTLTGIILAGWGCISEGSSERLVTNYELHDLILNCDDEFRSHLIWHIKSWSMDDNRSSGETWRRLLPELLRDVWPRQKSVKTPKTSERLFDLICSNTERFQEIFVLILPLLSPIKLNHFHISIDLGNILDSYPEQFLAIFHKVFADIDPTELPFNFELALDRMARADKQLRTEGQWLELKRKINHS